MRRSSVCFPPSLTSAFCGRGFGAGGYAIIPVLFKLSAGPPERGDVWVCGLIGGGVGTVICLGALEISCTLDDALPGKKGVGTSVTVEAKSSSDGTSVPCAHDHSKAREPILCSIPVVSQRHHIPVHSREPLQIEFTPIRRRRSTSPLEIAARFFSSPHAVDDSLAGLPALQMLVSLSAGRLLRA